MFDARPGFLLLGSGGDATPVQRDRQFADRLLRLGAAKFVDAISVHAYDWGAYGNWVWDAFEQSLG